MTFFAHVVDVPAPAEVYDATHAELLRRTGGQVPGLVVRLCRTTATGFQVVEVWTDREAFDRAERELVAPMLAEQSVAVAGAALPPPQVEELDLRGLVVPAGGIAT